MENLSSTSLISLHPFFTLWKRKELNFSKLSIDPFQKLGKNSVNPYGSLLANVVRFFSPIVHLRKEPVTVINFEGNWDPFPKVGKKKNSVTWKLVPDLPILLILSGSSKIHFDFQNDRRSVALPVPETQ